VGVQRQKTTDRLRGLPISFNSAILTDAPDPEMAESQRGYYSAVLQSISSCQKVGHLDSDEELDVILNVAAATLDISFKKGHEKIFYVERSDFYK